MKLYMNQIIQVMNIVIYVVNLIILSYYIIELFKSVCLTDLNENFADSSDRNAVKTKNGKYNWDHNDFKLFCRSIYPMTKYITTDEKEFIIKWLQRFDDEDLDDENSISTQTIGVTIHKNGDINQSRFAVGTLTKPEYFKNDCLKIMDKFKIDHSMIPKNKEFNFYGIAWDIEEKILKVYLLSKDKKKIDCYVYSVERENKQIKSSKYLGKKNYFVGEDKTVMYKQGKEINQWNTKKRPFPGKLLEDYKYVGQIIDNYTYFGWDLDSYSEYDGKINLYFD